MVIISLCVFVQLCTSEHAGVAMLWGYYLRPRHRRGVAAPTRSAQCFSQPQSAGSLLQLEVETGMGVPYTLAQTKGGRPTQPAACPGCRPC